MAIVLLLAASSGQSIEARQNDKRLDDLFEQLQNTDDRTAAIEIQSRIWQVWTQSGSDTVDLLMARAGRAMNRGDYDAALKHVDAVVELDPKFAEGWNRRATLYYLMGDFTASVADIERTLALEPRHFGALSGLGMIYSALEDEDGAIKAFRAALEVNPHLSGAREAMIELKKKLENRGI